MVSRRSLGFAVGVLSVLVVAGAAAPAIASPAPVSACPPCDEGFVRAAASHGLDTEVRESDATVRVHENGSATWTARVVPSNESVLNRLAENESLARDVAADSFGVRYGSGIDHELVSADVVDGAFVTRYRTLDVVRGGIGGTQVLTYFRDSPGAYIYTDLGADELTVVAPPGTTIARGFGDVDGRRMTATALPDVRDGPFVVFAPEGSPAPGLLGTLAVANALGGVILRNLLAFVVVPGGVLVGGLAGVRRYVPSTSHLDPPLLGGGVAAGGALLLVGTFVSEADALPATTGNLLGGGVAGAVLLALGIGIAVPGVRRRLTAGRLVGFGIGVGVGTAVAAEGVLGANEFHSLLTLGIALLPATVALGWESARATRGESALANRLFVGIAAAAFGVLLAFAPLTALGGTLFLIVPILLTSAALGVVVVAVPLYLLGAAGAPTGQTPAG
jgi:hypothetical protein